MTVGGMETNDPEKKPYRMQNTMRPPVEWIPTHANPNIHVAIVPGTMTFSGPILSAMKLGMMRPKMEAAFKMLSM